MHHYAPDYYLGTHRGGGRMNWALFDHQSLCALFIGSKFVLALRDAAHCARSSGSVSNVNY